MYELHEAPRMNESEKYSWLVQLYHVLSLSLFCHAFAVGRMLTSVKWYSLSQPDRYFWPHGLAQYLSLTLGRNWNLWEGQTGSFTDQLELGW